MAQRKMVFGRVSGGTALVVGIGDGDDCHLGQVRNPLWSNPCGLLRHTSFLRSSLSQCSIRSWLCLGGGGGQFAFGYGGGVLGVGSFGNIGSLFHLGVDSFPQLVGIAGEDRRARFVGSFHLSFIGIGGFGLGVRGV